LIVRRGAHTAKVQRHDAQREEAGSDQGSYHWRVLKDSGEERIVWENEKA
jgi:hypothetical protein